MTATPSQHRLAAQCCALTMLQAASMLLAAGAQAQANACDQLKGVLAARIDATGVRGYSLETVPAGTPVPPGAKAIGTCEAGASKILYRRWGAARASSDSPDRPLPPVPASAPSPTPPQPVASEDEAVRVVDRAVAPPQQVPLDNVAVAKVPLAQQASALMAENWRWMGALVLLPIAGWLWAWVAHRSAYDKAGLPRGPKL